MSQVVVDAPSDATSNAEPEVSRRGLLGRAAVVGSAAAALGPLSATEALAAPSYRPAAYRRTPVPRRKDRHLLNRFSYGVTPGLTREMKRAGGSMRWFEDQLEPDRIPDGFADGLQDWFPSLDWSPRTVWEQNVSGRMSIGDVMSEYARWCLLRRMYSRRQLHEVMTELWQNMLHIPTLFEACGVQRFSYDRTVRAHALGRFDELLPAAITHPAMLLFLDQATSTAKAPNENLGRELLELHTVGRSAYSESDVKNSARILTGWTVDRFGSWEGHYDRGAHWTGPVEVLGFRDANRSSDGRELTLRYLRHLAHHPATARRIAHRLAVRFVSDDPSASLVSHLAEVYLQHDTDIKPVLRALVRSSEFARAVDLKVRTPIEDVVATWRVLGVKPSRPRSSDDAVVHLLWQAQGAGQRPFGWPRPDGDPDSGEAWSSVSRMLGSFRIHYTMGGGWYPRGGLRYRRYGAWVPEYPIAFDALVDHLSRQLLGRKSTSRLLKAACQATGIRPGERITRDHPLIRYKMARLLSTLLDTPAHMSR